ncbi:serine O-acetyltransferase [Bifidobacterium sp. MA2]|uniref:Serine acetyltransferase n=1 Tax=Bifidobacterium santillanense TaxID=2809028 RepID=A0ABS5UP86_9BIFI|nr:serine O-acetyltransferase [Bifidobacterium santillanense]MBT1172648.1 serine O-acetyltransferase [Bifidobacterium santillanense]
MTITITPRVDADSGHGGIARGLFAALTGGRSGASVTRLDLRGDVAAVRAYDPSLSSGWQVLLTSTGMHAVWMYRLSHRLWIDGHRLAAQLVRAFSHTMTGVEIHPAATIGRRLIIDHGTGVVIGETAVIGDDVILHHQVTLGGRVNTPGKRHPTIGDRVYIGAGAMVLGNITVGDDSKIGAMALVLHDVPPRSVAIGSPAKVRPIR